MKGSRNIFNAGNLDFNLSMNVPKSVVEIEEFVAAIDSCPNDVFPVVERFSGL